MKRYLFTRELFRSRTLALAHLLIFMFLTWTSFSGRTPRQWLYAFPLFIGLWLVVFAYNVYARYNEFRLTLGATRRVLEAMKNPAEPEEPEAEKGYCFECAAEGVKIPAFCHVAAGPSGEAMPVCWPHARAQAIKNSEPKKVEVT